MSPDFPLGTEAARIGPLLSRLAGRADEAGIDSIWTMDHFFQSTLARWGGMVRIVADLVFGCTWLTAPDAF
jgi:alkanesulfonate monooxygenase SsuD/methylene tetrahydromethanopterin reductase-like flavin-dependent oxidoreductase (luciferase family)